MVMESYYVPVKEDHTAHHTACKSRARMNGTIGQGQRWPLGHIRLRIAEEAAFVQNAQAVLATSVLGLSRGTWAEWRHHIRTPCFRS